ncbi:MAG: HAMP domain-containing histidine kinase [Lachnospiraceae bacterium]|nr:HAMP domain-containing histidine kinase [Lachnospiraceae bacterium]
MKRRSIRTQFTVTNFILLAATILVCVLANLFFLEKYYVSNKMDNLLRVRELVINGADNGVLGPVTDSSTEEEIEAKQDFVGSLEAMCQQYNLTALIVDETYNPLIYSAMDLETVRNKLYRYILAYRIMGNAGIEMSGAQILEQGDDYFIIDTQEIRDSSRQIEIWGWSEVGYMYLFAVSRESIAESAAMSNRLLIVIGISAGLLAAVIGWITSSKISKPILELADISERITHLDFDAKYTGKDKNEIGVLGQNMNALSESLEETISQLKTANNELKRDLEQKTALEKQRQELLSNVSHELKTPIALIQGYAEGLKDGIADDPATLNEYLDVILDESNRMSRMVKSLMGLNELEEGRDSFTMERFDIAALTRNYLSSAEILISDSGAELVLNCPDSLYAWGDEFKVEEVLMNYISNAAHYVCGEAKRIEVTVESTGNQARISVYNTGNHIPEESLSRVWEKFYKVDKARTRTYGGSGVGLSIVKAIIEGMGQQYGVDNVDGGVCFWFTLEKVEQS